MVACVSNVVPALLEHCCLQRPYVGEVDFEEDSVTSVGDEDISETSLEEQPSDSEATSVHAMLRSETAYSDAGEHILSSSTKCSIECLLS